jgi:hypothetical protein
VTEEGDDAQGSSASATSLNSSAAAQPENPDEAMPPEMLAWIDAGTPDEHHEVLERFVGEWDAEATFRMGPDQPESTSMGSQSSEMVYDGRFVKSIYRGDFGGMPFEGMSLMGYDKIKKKYVSLWVDSMSTMIYTDSGSYDAESESFTMKTTMTDPMGREVQAKHVMRFEGDDRIVFEMHESVDGGEWFQNGTLVYTRR